jgi:hypothetical protein
MKRLMLGSALLLTFNSYAAFDYAQGSSISVKAPKIYTEAQANASTTSNTGLHTGFRFSITTGEVDWNKEIKSSKSESISNETLSSVSTSFGYQKINIADWGYSVLGTYSMISSDYYGKFYNAAIEGNVTYGINNNFYTYGGISFSKYSHSVVNDLYGTGTGIQLAIGYQVNKNIAFELKYLTALHTSSEKVVTASMSTAFDYEEQTEMVLSSFQLGFTGTF